MKSLGYLVYGLLYLGKSDFCELDPAMFSEVLERFTEANNRYSNEIMKAQQETINDSCHITKR